jgi:uncharacterized membrane protein
VLLMLGWHTVDAWTRPSARQSPVFDWVLLLGGFAAPLFLWLAGLSVALLAARTLTTGASRTDVAAMICRRGLEIFVLAFLFRLQAFIVSPGNHPILIFRVDILNVMGLSIVLAGLAWLAGETSRTRVVWYGGLAAGVAVLTPIVRTTPLVDALPQWLQWYLRPSGDLTTFTLFPWAGFVLAGSACGVLLSGGRDDRSERRIHAALAAVGLVLLALGHHLSTRPTIYAASEFWTSSPTWFVMRLGILIVALAVIHAAAGIASRQDIHLRSLARLGRSSLFVYWIHVELVYGFATWPLRARLPLWGALVCFVAFSALMYGAVVFRDRIAESHRRPAPASPAPRPAPAWAQRANDLA